MKDSGVQETENNWSESYDGTSLPWESFQSQLRKGKPKQSPGITMSWGRILNVRGGQGSESSRDAVWEGRASQNEMPDTCRGSPTPPQLSTDQCMCWRELSEAGNSQLKGVEETALGAQTRTEIVCSAHQRGKPHNLWGINRAFRGFSLSS